MNHRGLKVIQKKDGKDCDSGLFNGLGSALAGQKDGFDSHTVHFTSRAKLVRHTTAVVPKVSHGPL